MPLEWIEEWERDLPRWMQWAFFFGMLYVGSLVEFMANSRFLWPCLSDTALLLQSIGLILFYYIEYS